MSPNFCNLRHVECDSETNNSGQRLELYCFMVDRSISFYHVLSFLVVDVKLSLQVAKTHPLKSL